jgi:hypothetical protein
MKNVRAKIMWEGRGVGITGRKILITKDGGTTTIDLTPGDLSYTLLLEGEKTIEVRTAVVDAAGNESLSDVFIFTTPDLEAPLPDTNFSVDFQGVVEVPVDDGEEEVEEEDGE